jgi:hypothetical protein
VIFLLDALLGAYVLGVTDGREQLQLLVILKARNEHDV